MQTKQIKQIKQMEIPDFLREYLQDPEDPQEVQELLQRWRNLQLEDDLVWQIGMGATERIQESPVNRMNVQDENPEISSPFGEIGCSLEDSDEPVLEFPAASEAGMNYTAAQKCEDLESLFQRIDANTDSPLRRDSRHRTVICDGNPRAKLMIVGEAPGAEEDRVGRPFTGKAGMLLDRALVHLGLSRTGDTPENSVYLTNIAYWRPANNRTPTPEECLPLLPYCDRHIELIRPDFLLLLGNTACKNLLRTDQGITKLRGNWKEWKPQNVNFTIPALPTFHTAYLLRNPEAKELFWKDLLSLEEKMREAQT